MRLAPDPRFLVLGLAWLAAVSAMPVLAEDEQPDLKVEFVGLPIASGSREVQIRVTNVTDWWADATTARIETTAPTPGNVKPDVFVENLDPRQSTIITYTLDAGCNGHKVRVLVTAPKNYARVSAGAAGNRQKEELVCPASGQANPKPEAKPGADPGSGFDPNAAAVLTRPIGLDPNLTQAEPEKVLIPFPPVGFSQEFTLELRPTVTKSTWAERAVGGIGGGQLQLTDAEYPTVGWGQDETGGIMADYVSVVETAVFFDLANMDKIEGKNVNTAVLAFEEEGSKWTSGSGTPEIKPGCVEVLGIANTRWIDSGRVPVLVPNDFYDDAPRQIGSTREWNVKPYLLTQLQHPEDPTLRHGYVLRGGMNLADLTGDDDTNCISYAWNIRLVVKYTVRLN